MTTITDQQQQHQPMIMMIKPQQQQQLQDNNSINNNNNNASILSWHNLHVSLPPKKKSFFSRRKKSKTDDDEPTVILNNVSGCVPSGGSLVAIMGASGSGKSTLLNILTSRIATNASNLIVSGSVNVNGKPIDHGDQIAKISAYVQQDDIFFSVLTVKEHLWFQAMLRMDPKTTTTAQRQHRIDQVLSELGLIDCANSRIGNPEKGPSISGGERKRLSFASEILNDPAILFCDEPTSGLDAFMAESVVHTLRGMAQRGKTILCTIHQPSSDVFALFDHLVFMGTTAEASHFFKSVDLVCPPNFNPADFYIKAVATIPGKEKECQDRVKRISLAFGATDIGRRLLIEPEPASLPETIDSDDSEETQPMAKHHHHHHHQQQHESIVDSTATYKTGYMNQFRHVIWRSFVTNVRAREIFTARIAQTLVIALFTGLLYLRQDNNQKGVYNINGAIFLVITNMSFGSVYSVLHTFPTDIAIVKREHHAGMYSTMIYYASKMLIDIFHFTLIPFLFATIVYWMIGMRNDVVAYFFFVATVVFVTHVVVSLGYFVSGATANTALATLITSPVTVILMLFSGFIVHDASIPVYFSWLGYISWFRYAHEILCVNQWHNFGPIDCEFEESTTSLSSLAAAASAHHSYNNNNNNSNNSYNNDNINDGNTTNSALRMSAAAAAATIRSVSSRCFANGDEVLVQLNYSIDNYLRDFVAMVALLVAFRVAAYICLYLRVGRMRTIRPQPPSSSSSAAHQKQQLLLNSSVGGAGNTTELKSVV